MKQTIAFFDFDGTLTYKDSMFEIARFAYGNFQFYLGILLILPIILGFKLGFVDRQKTKEVYLKFFFGGISVVKFHQICDDFSKKIIPKILRPEGVEKILWHKSKGHDVVLVSASAENWLKKWCEEYNIKLIASQLEIQNEKITGNLIGNNCHGSEKVRRIREKFDLSLYYEIYAYGDTSGDKPMLIIADHQFYRKLR